MLQKNHRPLRRRDPAAEDKIDRPEDKEPRPEVVELERLLQIKDGEGDKERKGDDLLQDLELAHIHDGVADAVGGDLEHVFEKGDAPAHESGDEPGFVPHFLKVGIPGKGHEEVAEAEQTDRGEDVIHA